jgi:hypothetical protein
MSEDIAVAPVGRDHVGGVHSPAEEKGDCGRDYEALIEGGQTRP